jgi:small subunit ribosomal protein S21
MIIISNIKRIEYALKEYRRKVNSTKLLDEVKSRREYKKKSQKRREQMKKAKYKSSRGWE